VDGFYLYEVTCEGQVARLVHVLWVYRNPQEIYYNPIPAGVWQDLVCTPDLVESVTLELVDTLTQAIKFYPWRYAPRGVTVEGGNRFGCAAGNFMGIRVTFEEISSLIEAVKKGSYEEIERWRIHLAASFVHELVHNERDDGLVSTVRTEIASTIVQYLFNPHGNVVFNLQLTRSLARLERIGADGEDNRLDLYDRASYAALLIVVDHLAQVSEAVATAWELDTSPYRVDTLRRLDSLIGEPERRYLADQVIPEILAIGCQELLQRAQTIEERIGIGKDIIGIE
jgi:hypothetical protein